MSDTMDHLNIDTPKDERQDWNGLDAAGSIRAAVKAVKELNQTDNNGIRWHLAVHYKETRGRTRLDITIFSV